MDSWVEKIFFSIELGKIIRTIQVRSYYFKTNWWPSFIAVLKYLLFGLYKEIPLEILIVAKLIFSTLHQILRHFCILIQLGFLSLKKWRVRIPLKVCHYSTQIPIRRAWTLRFCNTLISSITIASTLLLRIMMFSFLFFSCMATFRLLVQKYPSMHACFLPSNFLRNAVSLWCHKLTPILFKDGVAVFLEKTSLPRRWWRIHFWTPSAKDTKHAVASYIFFFLSWSVFFFAS